MRIIVDLQACQNGSRNRGIGRYTMSMLGAMIDQSLPGDEFFIVLSNLFPDTENLVRKRLHGKVPSDKIFVLNYLPHGGSTSEGQAWRYNASLLLRQRAIEKLQPDIVFDPSPMEGLWDEVVTGPWSGPHVNVATVHDLIPLVLPKQHLVIARDKQGYLRRVEVLQRTDLLMAVSEFTRLEAINRLVATPNQIIATQLGCDHSLFRRLDITEAEAAALKTLYGISRRFILNASLYEYRKNLPGMIAAYSALDPALRKIYQLVFVGWFKEDAKQYVRSISAAEGIGPSDIVFVGHVTDSDLVKLYNICDLFVFPSLYEGFGLPALEAMACGAPVIGSNSTSIPEVIGEEALLFDPTDPRDIAAHMAIILRDPVRQAELRDRSAARAREFTWTRAARTVLQGMRNALEQKRSAATQLTHSGAFNQSRKIAFFWPKPHLKSRLEGCARTLLRVLAQTTSVTVIFSEPNGYPDWMHAICEFQSVDWMRAHRDVGFHYVHMVQTNDDACSLNHTREFPGLTVVINSIVEIDDIHSQTLPLWVADILESTGTAGLVKAFGSSDHGTAQMTGAHLCESSLSVLLASDASVMPQSTHVSTIRTGEIFAEPDSSAREAVRTQLKLATSHLVVAITQTDEDSDRIVSTYRQGKTTATLLVQQIEPRRTSWGVDLMSGVVRRTREQFDYKGLINAADAILLVGDLQPALKAAIKTDSVAIGIQCFDLSVDAPFPSIFENDEDQPIGSLIRSDNALALSRPLEQAARTCLALRREQAWIDEAAGSVRGVAPRLHDLAEFAEAAAANDAIARPPRVFVDMSSVTKSDRRLNRRSRYGAFLRGLLSVTSDDGGIEPIRFKDGGVFLARSDSAAFLELPSAWLTDRKTYLRSQDLIVCFDGLDPFAGTSMDLKSALNLIVMIDALLRRIPKAAEAAGRIVATYLIRHRQALLDAETCHFAHLDTVDKGTLPTALLTPSSGDIPANIAALRRQGRQIAVMDAADLESTNAIGSDLAAQLASLISTSGDEHLPTQPIERFAVMGHIQGTYSLAIINRATALALETARSGKVRYIPIETVPVTDLSSVPPDQKPMLETLVYRSAPVTERELIITQHYPIIAPPFRPGFAVSLLPWEETRLPKTIVNTLNSGFHGVIAPARSVAKALVDSGLKIPVAAIGQPSNIADFKDVTRRRTPRAWSTVFLHVSSCFPRKGVDVLLEAWRRAFRKSDNVKLVIKTFPNPHNTVVTDVASLMNAYPDTAPIEIINEDISLEQLKQLYATADAAVLPTRGEGFNLPALEAMMSQVPLIVTGFGGQMSFCSAETARLLGYSFAHSKSHVADPHSLWVEPDIDDLIEALREHIDPKNKTAIDKRVKKAREIALKVADGAGWVQRLDRFVDILETLELPEELPRIAWVTTWNIRCGIAQYSQFMLQSLPAKVRGQISVLSDMRTPPNDLMGSRRCWIVEQHGQAATFGNVIQDLTAEILVIQHQDGLISWSELASIVDYVSTSGQLIIIFLHNPRGLLVAGPQERERVVASLRKASRLLVHHLSDINLLKSLGLTENTALIPHGSLAARNAPPRVKHRDELADGPTIGCHGFFFSHKGIDKLIRALKILSKTWPNIRLRLLNARYPKTNSDDAISEAGKLAEQLHVASKIEWCFDFLEVHDIQDRLAECDLIVLPYDQSQDSASGAARIVLSTMVPVLATDVNIFDEFRTAFELVPNNDPNTLAAQIDHLLKSVDKRKEIQSNMRKWLDDHEWSKVSSNIEALLYSLWVEARMNECALPGPDGSMH